MAKLVEILALEMEEWPEGVTHLTQSNVDREIYDARDGRKEDSVDSLNPRFDTMKSHTEEAYPIVTRAQWQAERDKQKQKGGEWKRHRGGRQPVDNDAYVEVRLRCGDAQQSHAQDFIWPHNECDVAANLMKYRVISQPQAEEVEVEVTKPELTYKLDWVEVDDTKAAANPLAWRDTIIHCQAIIEDCEREIQANVNLLDSEGLFMQLEPKKGMQAYDVPAVDMGDWRNWKVGDILKTTNGEYEFRDGELVRLVEISEDRGSTRCEYMDARDYWHVPADSLEFVSRP